MRKQQVAVVATIALLGIFAAGCKKKAPVAPPPPPPPVTQPAPPPPAKPTALLSAEPSSVQRGEASTLRWTVTNATDISIDNGIAAVPATGTRQVFPSQTTTYTLSAKGPGGSVTASATVSVTAPPPPPPPPARPKPSLTERLEREVADAYFDYDKSEVREDARAVLSRNADALKSILQDYPGTVIAVEGHCDERGSAEYNLGLGDRRSTSAKEYLVQMGVPADRLRTVSYGKERPQCTEANESCYQKNRRAHFAAQ